MVNRGFFVEGVYFIDGIVDVFSYVFFLGIGGFGEYFFLFVFIFFKDVFWE